MKKTTLITLICLLALAIAGCVQSNLPVPESFVKTIEEKAVAQEALAEKYHLEKDEYSFYVNDTLVEDTDKSYDEKYDFNELLVNEYKGKKLTTTRGIAIGSEASDISKNYKGISCAIYFTTKTELTLIGIYDALPENPNRMLRRIKNSFLFNDSLYDSYLIRYHTYFIDGEFADISEVYSALRSKNLDLDDRGYYYSSISEIDANVLAFVIENGVVTNIHINHY